MFDADSFCCVCVQKCRDLKDINEADDDDVKYLNKLTSCAPSQKWIDNFRICENCVSNLDQAYEFVQQCVKSEELRERIIKESILVKLEEENDEYQCPLCPQTFTRKSSVKRHITNRHTGKLRRGNTIEKTRRRRKQKKPLEEVDRESDVDEKEPEVKGEEKGDQKPDELEDDKKQDPDFTFSDDDLDDPHDTQENEVYEVSVYNGGDYYCDFCPQTFTRKSSVKRHVLKQHSAPPPQTEKPQSQNDDNKCNDPENVEIKSDLEEKSDEDKSKFKLRKRRVLVRKKTAPKGPLKCTHCPKMFNRRDHWNIHIRNNHTFERPYECDQCPSKFTNSVALLMHKRNHKNERPFVCDTCGKNFVSSSHLANHKKIHQNKRSYRCEKCGKGFNMSGDLKKHNIIVHTDSSEWTHVCNICSKRFPLKAGLDNHVKRHMGIRDFICHICSKNFIDNNDLNKHIRTHSDDRNLLPCSICKDKIFKTKDGLAKHLKSNHNIGNAKRVKKKYPCSLCSKVFSANYKLHKHVLTHASSGAVPSWEDAVLPLFMPKSRILQPNPSYV